MLATEMGHKILPICGFQQASKVPESMCPKVQRHFDNQNIYFEISFPKERFVRYCFCQTFLLQPTFLFQKLQVMKAYSKFWIQLKIPYSWIYVNVSSPWLSGSFQLIRNMAAMNLFTCESNLQDCDINISTADRRKYNKIWKAIANKAFQPEQKVSCSNDYSGFQLTTSEVNMPLFDSVA